MEFVRHEMRVHALTLRQPLDAERGGHAHQLVQLARRQRVLRNATTRRCERGVKRHQLGGEREFFEEKKKNKCETKTLSRFAVSYLVLGLLQVALEPGEYLGADAVRGHGDVRGTHATSRWSAS